MTNSSAGVDETIRGLSRFFSRMAAAPAAAQSSADGLRSFLDRAGPLLRTLPVKNAEPVLPVLPPLDPERLRAAMAVLGERLRSAPPPLRPLNVWAVAGLERKELRNAAVLAWFLDPLGSHGLGAAVLSAVLDHVASRTKDWPTLGGDLSRTRVATEEWPLDSTRDRVDIVLDGTDFSIILEVKIDAPEGPDQIKRYIDVARRKALATGRTHGCVIVLGRRPLPGIPAGVGTITWSEVSSILSSVGPRSTGRSLAVQFAQHVLTF
jgi:hypothetical protein